MVGIDVLDVVSPFNPLALAEVDGFVADAFRPAKSPVGGVAVTDQQRVRGQHRPQRIGQTRLGQLAVAGDEIEGMAGAVSRHQDADLFVGSGSRYFCESLFWASQPKQAAKT